MRQILSLSLPAVEAVQLKKLAKSRGYSSLGAYVKFLFEADQDLMSETVLLKRVSQARVEYRAGKSIKAKLLADLL